MLKLRQMGVAFEDTITFSQSKFYFLVTRKRAIAFQTKAFDSLFLGKPEIREAVFLDDSRRLVGNRRSPIICF